VGFRIAPELAGKGLGYIFNVAKEAELLEKAAEAADSLGKKIVKAGEAIAAEAKVTTAPEAVTAEGLRVPVIEGEAPATEPFVAEMECDGKNHGSGVEVQVSREIILPKVQTFEQARNEAFDIIGDALGLDSKPLICGMEKSAGFGKVVGRISADKKVQWRLDWDPLKGMHIHVDNFRYGKGLKAKEYIIPFKGNEETFISLLKNLNR
jgi:hypothetical protein